MSKKTAFAFGLALAVGGPAAALAAQTPAPPRTAEDLARQKAATKFHSVEAEVVSADLEKMTITLKAEGAETTLPVSVLAKHRLRQVKAGDKVEVGCKDVDGTHTQVVSIRPAGEKKKVQ